MFDQRKANGRNSTNLVMGMVSVRETYIFANRHSSKSKTHTKKQQHQHRLSNRVHVRLIIRKPKTENNDVVRGFPLNSMRLSFRSPFPATVCVVAVSTFFKRIVQI